MIGLNTNAARNPPTAHRATGCLSTKNRPDAKVATRKPSQTFTQVGVDAMPASSKTSSAPCPELNSADPCAAARVENEIVAAKVTSFASLNFIVCPKLNLSRQ